MGDISGPTGHACQGVTACFLVTDHHEATNGRVLHSMACPLRERSWLSARIERKGCRDVEDAVLPCRRSHSFATAREVLERANPSSRLRRRHHALNGFSEPLTTVLLVDAKAEAADRRHGSATRISEPREQKRCLLYRHI